MAWLLVEFRGPATGTLAVVVGAGMPSVPGIPGHPIWTTPIDEGAADLGGSFGGSYSFLIRSSLDLLVAKVSFLTGDKYLRPYLFDNTISS